ncbi:hypothetical protein PYCC9005_000823 [Savitreella phatthalungensis]
MASVFAVPNGTDDPPTSDNPPTAHQIDAIVAWLEHRGAQQTGVKVGGLDVDGIVRGKLMSFDKFKSALKSGSFGFCSVTFGWDMHDKTYDEGVIAAMGAGPTSDGPNGFADIDATIDLSTFRRLPWDDNTPFFLLHFNDPSTGEPISADPRSVLRRQANRATKLGFKGMAGLEYEFFNFAETPQTLAEKRGRDLTPITPGNFGYSLARIHDVKYRKYFNDIHKCAMLFDCPLEGWHTETGPGVYEGALAFCELERMADRGAMFKFLCKNVGLQHGVTPSFMAKPVQGLSGNSGHMHVSLASLTGGSNLFYRDRSSGDAEEKALDEATVVGGIHYKDLENFSAVGRHFLAGVLAGLPDLMPVFAPTINSYKRLVENFWAPVDVSWGLEHRLASLRLISPANDPATAKKATRIEVRVPGADTVPHLALAAIFGAGLRGIEMKLKIDLPPLGHKGDPGSRPGSIRLAKDLREAVGLFAREGSIAREIFGDGFVNHYAATRHHELKLWQQAVTEWEVARYIETV